MKEEPKQQAPLDARPTGHGQGQRPSVGSSARTPWKLAPWKRPRTRTPRTRTPSTPASGRAPCGPPRRTPPSGRRCPGACGQAPKTGGREPAPATPRPSRRPGVSSFGPRAPDCRRTRGRRRSARPDERIWEPRRLYQQPQLEPRRRGDPASPSRRTRPQRAQQDPQQQGPPHGTAPRDVRSGETAVPKPESAAQQGAAQQSRRHSGPAVRDHRGQRPGTRFRPILSWLARPGGRRAARTQARTEARARPVPSAWRTGCTSAT